MVETSRAKLLGRYMADAEKNTEEMLEGALGGAVFFDEMHTLHERGYSTGDPYGNAIINTLLLYMENHRDELVVFGAGYAKATERMLEVNQGLRRRFSTVIEFHSYTPPELIELTKLMVGEDEDVTTDEAVEVLRPDFERFYADENLTAEGDLIRGIDVLGNAGFVRNVVEKARDHRNDRLDTTELDELAGQRRRRGHRGAAAAAARTDPRGPGRGFARGGVRKAFRIGATGGRLSN